MKPSDEDAARKLELVAREAAFPRFWKQAGVGMVVGCSLCGATREQRGVLQEILGDFVHRHQQVGLGFQLVFTSLY